MQQMTYGAGGWVRVHEPSRFAGWLYFRLDPAIGSVTSIYLDGDGREVTPAALRALPLTKYVAQARQRPDLFLAANMAFRGSLDAAPDQGIPGTLDALFTHGRGVGYKQPTRVRLAPPTDGLTDDFLRNVADAYVSALAHGERPNKALAEQTGYRARTVERWTYLARKAGYLSPTRPGEAR